jgi:VWFA-related protein
VAGVSAQTQEPPQQPTFRTGVDLVAVDVAVMDSRGRPVDDLRAPEFLVKIDGQQRRVVSAELVRIDVEAARKEAASDVETLFTSNLVPPNGRMIVIAVDQSNIRPGAARPILASAARFLDRLSPADSVAFVAFPPPGESVGFTTNHIRIREAMKRVVGTQSRFKGKFNLGIWEAIAISENHDETTRRAVVLRECGLMLGGDLERCEREIETEASEITLHLRQDTAASLRGLRDLLAGLVVIEGPKSLILLSEGLHLEGLGGELDDIAALAGIGRVSINVLLMDVPRFEVTQAQMPPTATEDRELQVQGLETLAGMSRGSLFRVIGTGDSIFERLSSETSAYYMLGVEQASTDRDGKRHRIDVEVRRKGVTLRSRRAFVLSGKPEGPKTIEQRLADALKSPFAVTELPMRLTTYSYRDPSGSKVRVILAAEVGQAGTPAAEYTIGYAAIDDQGQVATSGAERRQLSPIDGQAKAPLGYSGGILLDPGTYTVRFAAVDSEGRRGSVVREVQAWQISGQEFTVGDLMIGNMPAPKEPLKPAVEPQLHSGQLAAYVELYGSGPAAFEKSAVTIEIAEDEASETIAASPASLVGSQPNARVAQALMTTRMLPPGRYIARAQITRDGKPIGLLLRPFIVVPSAKSAEEGAAIALPASLLASIPKFDREALLKPEVVTSMIDALERSSPALKEALAEARAGRYGAAALEALGSGDQTAAQFLRGLELFTKGQIDQAAIQLQNAAGPRREYFPAALYLGACFAAAGRDRDAAGVWQLAFGKEPRPSLAYALFADARLREGQAASVIDVLRPALERTPTDDAIGKRLALAYVMTGRFADALPVLDAYLTRNPTDQEALFSAVMSQYEVSSLQDITLAQSDRQKLTRYARAYKGPQQALVARYLSALGVK